MEASSRTAVSSISVEQFAEATFSAVLRALDTRAKQSPAEAAIKSAAVGPIIYGIIAWPEGFPSELSAPQGFAQ